jgi:hypothetical protein
VLQPWGICIQPFPNSTTREKETIIKQVSVGSKPSRRPKQAKCLNDYTNRYCGARKREGQVFAVPDTELSQVEARRRACRVLLVEASDADDSEGDRRA